jgi:hypothetical protein
MGSVSSEASRFSYFRRLIRETETVSNTRLFHFANDFDLNEVTGTPCRRRESQFSSADQCLATF